MPSLCTRRDLLRSTARLAGGLAAARLGAAGACALGQQQSQFEALKKAGWDAIAAHDWKGAEERFVRASQLGELGEGELRMISACRRLLRRFADALPVARMNSQKHPCPFSHMEYAQALADTGDFASARSIMTRLKRSSMDEKESTYYREVALKVGIKEWCLTVNFTKEGLVPRAREAVQRNGYFEFDLLADDQYQKCTYAVTGAERHDETTDKWGARRIRLYPRGDDAVGLRVSIVDSPYVADLSKAGGYDADLPAAVKEYLAATPLCDPTTQRVKEIAGKVKGRTPIDTVANVSRWWDENLRYPTEAERSDFRAYFDKYGGHSEAALRRGAGWCWEQTHAVNAILRAAGVPARELLVYIDIANPTGTGMHIISNVYLVGLGWLPFENNKPFGHPVDQYLPISCDTPEDTNPRDVRPHPANDGSGMAVDSRVTTVYDRFLRMFWGTTEKGLGMKHVQIELKQLLLTEARS